MGKKYDWDSDTRKWVDRKPREVVYAGPMIQPDLPDHVSPVTGEVLGGRRDRREHMIRHDLREVDPSERPPGAGIPKTQAQAAAERAQLADRHIANLSPQMRERLMRGG